MKKNKGRKLVAIVHQYNTAPFDLTVEKLIGYGRTPYQRCGIPVDPKADEEAVQKPWKLPEPKSLKIRQYLSFPAVRSSVYGSLWHYLRSKGGNHRRPDDKENASA